MYAASAAFTRYAQAFVGLTMAAGLRSTSRALRVSSSNPVELCKSTPRGKPKLRAGRRYRSPRSLPIPRTSNEVSAEDRRRADPRPHHTSLDEALSPSVSVSEAHNRSLIPIYAHLPRDIRKQRGCQRSRGRDRPLRRCPRSRPSCIVGFRLRLECACAAQEGAAAPRQEKKLHPRSTKHARREERAALHAARFSLFVLFPNKRRAIGFEDSAYIYRPT